MAILGLFSALQTYRLRRSVRRLRREIIARLRTQDYLAAFAPFHDENRRFTVNFLEHVTAFNLREVLEENVHYSRVTPELIEEIFRYSRPGLSGFTDHHWSIDMRDVSVDVLRLAAFWKQLGVKVSNLSEPHQWVWDHIDLYDAEKPRLRCLEALQAESPIIARLLDPRSERVPLFSVEELNDVGPTFGTPLHALLLHYSLRREPETKAQIQQLRAHGACLSPSEETVFMRELLETLEV